MRTILSSFAGKKEHVEPCRVSKTCARRQEKQAQDSARWGGGAIYHLVKGTGQTQFSTKFAAKLSFMPQKN
jgi:hypothetical protein